jgi:hypothetical protein
VGVVSSGINGTDAGGTGLIEDPAPPSAPVLPESIVGVLSSPAAGVPPPEVPIVAPLPFPFPPPLPVDRLEKLPWSILAGYPS